ncbi:MAG: phosphatase PAP2 family protein [Aggregatilineales bacterium]
MLTPLETGLGLEIVLSLQSSHNSVLDALARTLAFMGDDLFFLFVLPLIYWSINRQLGIHLLLAIIFGGLFNVVLKEVFATPRPYQVSDDVRLIVGALGYGFPSGHVMASVVVWGYLATVYKRTWLTIAVVIYVLLMGWARMYAGAHYPQDVLGGIIFGIIALMLFLRLIDPFPKLWSRLAIQPKTAMIVLTLIAGTVFVIQDEYGAALLGLLAGVGIGGLVIDLLDFHFDASSDFRRRTLCFIVGIVILVTLFFGLRIAFAALVNDESTLEEVLRVIRYFIVSLFAYAGFPLLAARLGLVERKPDQITVARE